MKVLVQKCASGSVIVKEENYKEEIGLGLVLFVGFTEGDHEDTIRYMAKKVSNLRIFEDENGIMNLSVLDVSGSVLSVSQFTLYANTSKGNRPSYIEALSGEKASILYDFWNEELKKYVPVKTGIFGADMVVKIENKGPTTIMLEK